MAEKPSQQINDLIFRELIKCGYSKENDTRIWNIADSKLWCLTQEQAQAYLDLEYSDEYSKRVIEKETKFFTENIPNILTSVGNNPINIIDIGCGDGKKIAKIIEKTKNKEDLVYCPIDINEHMVKTASEEVKNTGVKEVVEFEHNVSDDKNSSNITEYMRKNHHKKNIIFLLGNTIGNSDINETLFNLKNSMNESDILVIDSVIDTEGQERCLEFYRTDKDIYNWLVHIPEKLGLDKNSVELGTRFKNNRVEIFFRIKESKKIEMNNQELNFNKNDEIIVIVSYRYKIRDFRSFLSMNFNQVDVFANKNGSMVLAICKK